MTACSLLLICSVRVYSGRAESGSYVVNAYNGQCERLGRILEMNAAERIDRDDAAAGVQIATQYGLNENASNVLLGIILFFLIGQNSLSTTE